MIDLSGPCRAWNLPPLLSTEVPPTGTIHHIQVLNTSDGVYILRQYRYSLAERWPIECEHALSTYVQAQGLPASAPLPLPTGETILEHERYFYALFRCVRGSQLSREQLTLREAVAMGRFLGELHHVLHHYPHHLVPHRSFNVDRAATFLKIEELERAIRSRSRVADVDLQILAQLSQRRTWLTSASSVDEQDFSLLEQQVIHGDYQETNLFFEQDNISAVIDWDQAYVAPRAWEVVRTLHYAFKLDPALCQAFLDAYNSVFSLSFADLNAAASLYGWKRANDVSHYEEIYLKNNERMQTFLQPGGRFTPFIERWSSLLARMQSRGQ
jgi:homoserine kinase type II